MPLTERKDAMPQQNYSEAEQRRILEQEFPHTLKVAIHLSEKLGIQTEDEWRKYLRGVLEGYWVIAKPKD